MNPYHDITDILFDEPTILRRLDELAAQITADYAGRDLTLVALLNGAIITASDLIRRIPLPLHLDCVAVASYHGATATSGTVTFRSPLPEIDGRDVLVVDDILDTGLTLDAVVKKLKTEAAPRSVKTLVLLRKRRDRLAAVDADYAGFDIPDAFVVGYGLDYLGHYRNLPFIGTLDPARIGPAA